MSSCMVTPPKSSYWRRLPLTSLLKITMEQCGSCPHPFSTISGHSSSFMAAFCNSPAYVVGRLLHSSDTQPGFSSQTRERGARTGSFTRSAPAGTHRAATARAGVVQVHGCSPTAWHRTVTRMSGHMTMHCLAQWQGRSVGLLARRRTHSPAAAQLQELGRCVRSASGS